MARLKIQIKPTHCFVPFREGRGNKTKLIFYFLLLFNIHWAFAAAELQQQTLIESSPSSKKIISYDFCPPPNKLTPKEGLFWESEGGWVSYGESFDTEVVHFIKVQWIGINVGKIICLYKGEKKYGFPIALEQKYHKVVPSPTGFKWSKDLGGYKECVSQHVKDCGFVFEKPSEKGDLYEGLDFFKGKKDLDD